MTAARRLSPELPPPLAASSKVRRVLVVDDSRVNQLVLRTLLLRRGFQVVTAARGDEAVRMATEQQFDLILMDVQMPEMDGLEATRRIRGFERQSRHTPVVAVTACEPCSRDQCLSAGMDDYLTKPVCACELDRVLGQLG